MSENDNDECVAGFKHLNETADHLRLMQSLIARGVLSSEVDGELAVLETYRRDLTPIIITT